MTYIKNNKVFLFLFTILFCLLLVLAYQFVNPTTTSGPIGNVTNNSSTPQITNFYGQFSDDKLAVELSWSINQGNKKIEKIELVYAEGRVKDVSELYSVSLPLNTYNILTGNNEFVLRVYFSDETILTKSIYVYINEAYDFSVSVQNMDNKSILNATYYYDKRKPLKTPNVSYSGDTTNFTMQFIASEKLEEKDNQIKMKVVYELLYNDVKRGDYSLNLTYTFPEYNLDIDYPISFRVASEVDVNE